MSENQNHLRYTTRQKDTDAFIKKICESASLYLSKFPFIAPAGVTDRKTKKAIEQKKQDELKKICSLFNNSKESVCLPQIPGSISFTAINKGRLLVNHTGGVLECNLALHRFFNCPIIPGSAVKGIARNAGRFDEDQDRFARVFGGAEKGKSDQAGSVAFLMAIPENNNWQIVPDVLTSHHGSDTENPTPVFFPAVESGATFRFTVAPTDRTKDGDLEFAVKCLKLALSENGAGAKTAAGYGWFEVMEDK